MHGIKTEHAEYPVIRFYDEPGAFMDASPVAWVRSGFPVPGTPVRGGAYRNIAAPEFIISSTINDSRSNNGNII